MAELRLGYAVADAALVEKMRPLLTDVDLNCAAVAAGRAALADTESARTFVKRNADDQVTQSAAWLQLPGGQHEAIGGNSC